MTDADLRPPSAALEHHLGAEMEDKSFTLTFLCSGERYWGEAPPQSGLLFTSVLVIPNEPPGNGTIGWLRLGVGLFSCVELVASIAQHEHWPLCLYVPPRQTFFIQAERVDTPFSVDLGKYKVGARITESDNVPPLYDQPLRNECFRGCSCLVPPAHFETRRVTCKAPRCLHAPYDYDPGENP